jgi:long-chain acyl-CoA synthetase
MFSQRTTAAQYLSGPKNLSYTELEDGIRQVAAHLAERQLAGRRVLFVVRDDAAFAPLLLGCMRAGAIPLLLDPGTAAQQLGDILAHSRVDGLIADADLIAQWREHGVALPALRVPVLKQAAKGQLLSKLLGRRAPVDLESWPGLLQRPPSAALPPPRQDGIAYVVFTSGSTARPKGVEMSWPAILGHLATLERHYGLTPASRIMNLMPLSHADGLVQGLLLAYRYGLTLLRPATFSIVNIEAILIAIYRDRASHLVAAPTALALIQQYGAHLAENFATDAFRFVVSCSAPLSEATWTDFSARFG